MKDKDLLLLAGLGVAGYLFLQKKTTAGGDGGLLGGLGGAVNQALEDWNSFWDALFRNLFAQQGLTQKDYQDAAERGMLPLTPSQLTKRWTSTVGIDTRNWLAGITQYGAYSGVAIEASAVSRLYDVGAAVRETSAFARQYGGTVGTAYSPSGGAIPVAVVPYRGTQQVGLYTTLNAYISQATGMTPSAAAASRASLMARGIV